MIYIKIYFNLDNCLGQALFYVMLEKFLIKVPSVAGKMEQFYNLIVEMSVNGNEEIQDDNDPEFIRRNRTKYSIVKSLKHSESIRIRYVVTYPVKT